MDSITAPALHLSRERLDAGVDEIRRSPSDGGALTHIVRRPAVGERESLEVGELHTADGLVGDNWKTRGSSQTADKSAHPDMQITVMNSRAAVLIAGTDDRLPLAGDQLFIDLDLSSANLPPGSRLAVGSAILEITEVPHTGCKSFLARFGTDAMRFVNSPVGRSLNLRGVNARVILGGEVRVGDVATKVALTRND